MKKISALDLFHGIGGPTKGLELAGIPIYVGFDVDQTCSFAYEQNNLGRFVHCDVTELDQKTLHGYYPHDTDSRVLARCAPCQPFSRLSGKYRMKGYKASTYDSRQTMQEST